MPFDLGSFGADFGSSLFSAGVDWLAWEGQKDFARENRRWMAKREDTAVQRRVADLIAAGLNPMLAYNSAAQSSASAAQPSGPRPAEAMASGAARDLNSAQAAKIRAETGLIETQRRVMESEITRNVASAQQSAWQSSFIEASIPKIRSEIAHLDADTALKNLEAYIKGLEGDKLRQTLQYLVRAIRSDTLRKELGIDTVTNVNEFERGVWDFINTLQYRLSRGGPQ